MRLTEADIDAAIHEAKQLATLLERDLPRARRLARDFHSGGYPSGGGSGGRSSDISRPTEAAALRDGTDPANSYLTRLTLRIANMNSASADLRQTVTSICAHAEGDAMPDGTRRASLGAGHCRACDYNATGNADDRLRGGLCDRCRKRFQRDPGRWEHDRNRFINETRRGDDG